MFNFNRSCQLVFQNCINLYYHAPLSSLSYSIPVTTCESFLFFFSFSHRCLMGITLWFQFSFSLPLMKFNFFPYIYCSFNIHFCEMCVQVFCHFSIGFLSFFLFICLSVSDMTPLSHMCIANTFFHSMCCLFTLNGVLAIKYLIFTTDQFAKFSFMFIDLSFLLKKYFSPPKSHDNLLWFLWSIFFYLRHIYKVKLHETPTDMVPLIERKHPFSHFTVLLLYGIVGYNC